MSLITISRSDTNASRNERKSNMKLKATYKALIILSGIFFAVTPGYGGADRLQRIETTSGRIHIGVVSNDYKRKVIKIIQTNGVPVTIQQRNVKSRTSMRIVKPAEKGNKEYYNFNRRRLTDFEVTRIIENGFISRQQNIVVVISGRKFKEYKETVAN